MLVATTANVFIHDFFSEVLSFLLQFAVSRNWTSHHSHQHIHTRWVSFYFYFCFLFVRPSSWAIDSVLKKKKSNLFYVSICIAIFFFFSFSFFTYPFSFSLFYLCFVKICGRGERGGVYDGKEGGGYGRSGINSIAAMWLYLRTLHPTSPFYLLWPSWLWYIYLYACFPLYS